MFNNLKHSGVSTHKSCMNSTFLVYSSSAKMVYTNNLNKNEMLAYIEKNYNLLFSINVLLTENAYDFGFFY